MSKLQTFKVLNRFQTFTLLDIQHLQIGTHLFFKLSNFQVLKRPDIAALGAAAFPSQQITSSSERGKGNRSLIQIKAIPRPNELPRSGALQVRGGNYRVATPFFYSARLPDSGDHWRHRFGTLMV